MTVIKIVPLHHLVNYCKISIKSFSGRSISIKYSCSDRSQENINFYRASAVEEPEICPLFDVYNKVGDVIWPPRSYALASFGLFPL